MGRALRSVNMYELNNLQAGAVNEHLMMPDRSKYHLTFAPMLLSKPWRTNVRQEWLKRKEDFHSLSVFKLTEEPGAIALLHFIP